MGRQLIEQSTGSMKPVVAFCVKEMPTLKTSLPLAYSAYVVKLEQAAAPALERYPELSEPQPANPQMIADVGEMVLGVAKQMGAKTYCPALMNKLQSAKVEALQAQFEKTLTAYEKKAKAQESTAPTKAGAPGQPDATPQK